jgi:hypothetical protein
VAVIVGDGAFLDTLPFQCSNSDIQSTPKDGSIPGTVPSGASVNSNVPILMCSLLNTTAHMCQKYFDPNRLFGKLHVDARKVHFIDAKGHFLTVNTFPFITSGSFGSSADVVMGSNNGLLEENFDLSPFSSRQHLVIQIRGDNLWDQIKLLQSNIPKLKDIKKITLIIGHSDLGFPSGMVASSRADTEKGVQAHVPALTEFLKQKGANQQDIQWTIFASNYDDYNGSINALVHPIPLGLTTAAWIKDQLQSLCNLASTVVSSNLAIAKAPQRWLFVSFKTENNADERNRAMAVAKKLASAAPHPDSVGFIRDNFDRTIHSILEYRFVLTPAGRGLDSHRILEALMLGRIPIVISAPYLCAFDGLPILRLNSWEELTWPLLEQAWNRFSQYSAEDIQRLFITKKIFYPYWKSLIEREQQL